MDLENSIFAASAENFEALAMRVFEFQYEYNAVYRRYCGLLNKDPDTVDQLSDIPFLPVSFFKHHDIRVHHFEPEVIFESSGTTNTVNSRHLVKDLSLYRKSFTKAFEKFYGPADTYCILGLLPNYIERGNSSLVLMVDELVKRSGHPLSGFYLYDTDKLYQTLLHNEIRRERTLLIGVTYALLDFAERYPMQLRHTVVMETGGMKGRRDELTRQQVHDILKKQLGLSHIHSEYGMTELLSQAYSRGEGIFHCPSWMKILLRAEDDPFHITGSSEAADKPLSGLINIADLANIHSCAFIATDDVGRLHANGSFEVLGRMDNSDIRGCSLLAV